MLVIKKAEIEALGFDFDKAVSEYIAACVKHQSETGTAAPAAPHALVERAVIRAASPGKPDTFVANYAYEPEPAAAGPATLDEKKDALERAVSAAANEAYTAVSPRRQQMLLRMHVDAAQAVAPEKRTPEQNVALGVYAVLAEKLKAINWQLAEQLAEIDVLTEADVDTWQPKPFPTT